MKWIGALIILVMFSSSAFAAEPKPLFAAETPINLRLEAPFKKLTAEAKRSTNPFPAKMTLRGGTPETHEISLSARGKSRREKGYCRFPPLRIRFGNKDSGNKPKQDSLFQGQKSLKLVTHCKPSNRNQQYTLLEYTAYRFLNIMTEDSLRVRLANIEYVDSTNGKTLINRAGFFIEDMDDAAKRTGRKELDIPAINLTQVDGPAGARTALFHYMISNLDWSMTKGPDGSDCCHNSKLMSVEKNPNQIVPVPYDFDQSGFVSTDYAEPPANIPVRSVKTRVYRGHCALNQYVPKQAAAFGANKSQILTELNLVPGLKDGQKTRIRKYLEPFFETMQDPKKLDSRVLKRCRK